MLIVLAIFNACSVINKFTTIAGELFGMLIAVLFIQQAVKGVVSEFKIPKAEDATLEKYQFQWLYTNGLLGIIYSFGLLFTALKSRKARSWLYGTGLQSYLYVIFLVSCWAIKLPIKLLPVLTIGSLRSFIADYGVSLMVLAWTAMSFSAPSRAPSGIPRRLYSPLPWEAASMQHWSVIKDMARVPPPYIFAAFIPALMIAGLYFFDHTVASQLAQQEEFNRKNLSA